MPEGRPGGGASGPGGGEANQRLGAGGILAFVVDERQAFAREFGRHPDVQDGGGAAVPLQHQVANTDPVRRQLQRDAVEGDRRVALTGHHQLHPSGAAIIPQRQGELPILPGRDGQDESSGTGGHGPRERLLQGLREIRAAPRPELCRFTHCRRLLRRSQIPGRPHRGNHTRTQPPDECQAPPPLNLVHLQAAQSSSSALP